ncbi:MAG: riboflavin synthase [Alphaproteobacteria bacterium]
MFTGIVSAVGEIVHVAPGPVTLLEVRSPYNPDGVDIGASINHSGVCLTVIEKRRDGAGMVHSVEAAPETLMLTTLGQLRPGSRVNLERALKAGDELGGHIVAGHVDGAGTVRAMTPDGGSMRFTISLPKALAPLVAAKGSIAIDGVSLTVTEVDRDSFGVMIIPHTSLVTTLSSLKVGDMVNLEIDTVARYVARLLDARKDAM